MLVKSGDPFDQLILIVEVVEGWWLETTWKFVLFRDFRAFVMTETTHTFCMLDLLKAFIR